ncbi:UDP-N-acetylmuramoyl-L-alanine:D-glutamate ligase [Erysipelotrichaceae bacterium]|nr:UDP-N-acetylmuramoyl-L-alanine:D-glutamate ligase [Erysipelotrichaceae bacterium]
MQQTEKYRGLNILVVGMGISGFSVALLLKKLGASVVVNENLGNKDTEEVELLEKNGIQYIGDGHHDYLLDGVDLLVKNPGIPYHHPFIVSADLRKIPIITETEVAMSVCDSRVITITGTNGKTTTTMLIHAMLKAEGVDAHIAGNIGVPFSDVVQKTTEKSIIVLELSSFQLLGMPNIKPSIALILNLDEAHIDYHKTLSDYYNAKKQIFKNMDKNDKLILNYDDTRLMTEMKNETPSAQMGYFSTDNSMVETYIENETIYYQNEQISHISDIAIPGAHNLQNVLAAVAATKSCAISNAAIKSALQHFTGVEHRLEYVQTLEGRKFYNDSKSTNISAAKVALAAFKQPIIWIAGGLDRGNDISDIIPFCKDVKMIISFGESKDKFTKLAAKMAINSVAVDTLLLATKAAYTFSEKDDIILLSPACASWDQFQNFEQRGKEFKQICINLGANKEELS